MLLRATSILWLQAADAGAQPGTSADYGLPSDLELGNAEGQANRAVHRLERIGQRTVHETGLLNRPVPRADSALSLSSRPVRLLEDAAFETLS